MEKFMGLDVPEYDKRVYIQYLRQKMCLARACPRENRDRLCHKCIFTIRNEAQFIKWLTIRNAAGDLLEQCHVALRELQMHISSHDPIVENLKAVIVKVEPHVHGKSAEISLKSCISDVRALNVARYAGIKSLADLARLGKGGLLSLRGCGVVVFGIFEKALSDHGLKLNR